MSEPYRLPASLTKEEKEMFFRYCKEFKDLGFWDEEKQEPRLRSRIVKMWVRGFDVTSRKINSFNFSVCLKCQSTFWSSKDPIAKCPHCGGETITLRQVLAELEGYKKDRKR